MLRTARSRAAAALAVLAVTGALLVPGTASAAPQEDPQPAARSALGGGLDRLVGADREEGALRIDRGLKTIEDARGRVLVTLTPQADEDPAAFRAAAEAAGLRVTADAPDLGTLEGFATAAAARRLAALPGTGTLAQVPAPRTAAGSVQSQGVALQRVDRVLAQGIDGRGVTVGVLSDSYDAALLDADGEPQTVRAAQDVASGDLPGPGNPVNEQPVVVIEDLPEGEDATDEGRAMLQIVHDMAPAAKLCFATAFTGELGFADNIRALADPAGPCGADVIVDDVGYFSEPFFSDGVIGDAIDEVAASGVQYFSSAGNSGQEGGWESPVRLVGAGRAADAGLDLGDVDPALYDGGLQDMRVGRGVDVAQTITLGEGGGLFNLQWNDPFDLDGATYGDAVFEGAGELTEAAPSVELPFTPTADQVGDVVEFRVDGVPSGTTDLVLGVVAPDGTPLAEVDTGASPEVYDTTLTQAGTYTIVVSGFDGALGDFTADVRPVLAPSRVTTDFNALFFDAGGAYLGALADLNRLSGRPQELTGLAGLPTVQVVIARSGTGRTPVDRLRIISSGDLYFTERPDPLAVTAFGHPTAAGAIAVGAQNAFRPTQPEPFTSVGGRLEVFFDSAGERYRKVQRRTVPLITAADGVNTSFFFADTVRDEDATPNFFGTSAAAPSAAGIAALVLDARGSGRSVSVPRMRTILSEATFPHDLDPFRAAGSAQGLTVVADGPVGDERSPVPGTLDDRDFFTLAYTGRGRLRSVTFDGATAAPTALGTDGRSAGIVFDTRPLAFDDETGFAAGGFPFTADRKGVRATFAGTSGLAVAGQHRTMTLTFDGGLRRGSTLRFGVDRDLAVSGFGDASEGNGADVLGGGVLLPEGRVLRDGLRFTAVRTDGSRFTGVIRNRIGDGFTPLDGYGLIDAEEAVLGR